MNLFSIILSCSNAMFHNLFLILNFLNSKFDPKNFFKLKKVYAISVTFNCWMHYSFFEYYFHNYNLFIVAIMEMNHLNIILFYHHYLFMNQMIYYLNFRLIHFSRLNLYFTLFYYLVILFFFHYFKAKLKIYFFVIYVFHYFLSFFNLK